MSGIVCAVRGGPDSQSTMQKAISLALEVDLPLYFLYVVNLDFLSHTQSARISTITEELNQMGEFILLSAQEKAQSKGVQAQGVVRHGNVREEIVNFAKEISADYVVIGLPVGEDHERNIFLADRLKDFGDRIEEECNAKVILTGDEQKE